MDEMMLDDSESAGLSPPETVDEFVGAVPWTRNRMVLVFVRHHAGKCYARFRTFSRHKVKGCRYPSPRFFNVPLECAGELAEALQAAVRGEPYGDPPDWFQDFEKQYLALSGRKSFGSCG